MSESGSEAGKAGKAGRVYLVGAGPGDPDLITVKGLKLLSRASVVVTDRLANKRLLNNVPDTAEIIYAGKSPRAHTLSQQEIIDVLVDRASAGKTVVRLKGGDPFVFGRGGEEAAALAEAGIEFEVVPGISSAIAAPAYAGIPVTSRSRAVSLGIITGHEAADKAESDIKWRELAAGLDTIVCLMGVENLRSIVEKLLQFGRAPETPAAVIEWATYSRQRTITGTLADISGKCAESGIGAPAVFVAGDVVNLRRKIAWFERRPLFGRRVMVTRALHQAPELTELLEEAGADVDEYPMIRFVWPSDLEPLDAAISGDQSYDWIVFTSANGVDHFFRRALELGRDARVVGDAKLAAIGPKTAAALESFGLKVDFVPSRYISEAVASEFPGDIAGQRILIPRAQEAGDELPRGLRARGAEVNVVTAYRTVADKTHEEDVLEACRRGEVDIVTFASSSAVKSFFEIVGEHELPETAAIACIGPVTASAVRSHGVEPDVVAEDYTIEGLVGALTGWACREKTDKSI